MPGALEDKRAYCVEVIKDHGDMLERRDNNRAGYTMLHLEHGLQTFAKLKALYEKLVDLQMARRAVAIEWLHRFDPEALPECANTASLVPHTEEWFAILSRQNRQQAKMVRFIIQLAGRSDVCTFCGDEEARDHRYTGDNVQPATVITCKLCDDCHGIRRTRFAEEFSPI